MNPLSVVMEALGGSLAHEAEREAAMFNIRALRRSSFLEEANAVAAQQRGNLEAGLYAQRGSNLQGQQRMAQAMGNIDSTSGTAAQVSSATEALARLDAETAKNNARRAAMGHKEMARRYREDEKRLADRWLSEGVTGSRADDEYFAKTAASVLSSALSFGLGGK